LEAAEHNGLSQGKKWLVAWLQGDTLVPLFDAQIDTSWKLATGDST